MTPVQVWMEGYKARGEACKQGGVLAALLITAIAASIRNSASIWWATKVAVGCLSVGVVCSGFAFFYMGLAVTTFAEKAPANPINVADVTADQSKLLGLANCIGQLEIISLVFGLIFTMIHLAYL